MSWIPRMLLYEGNHSIYRQPPCDYHFGRSQGGCRGSQDDRWLVADWFQRPQGGRNDDLSPRGFACYKRNISVTKSIGFFSFSNVYFQIDEVSYLEITAFELFYSYVFLLVLFVCFFVTRIPKIMGLVVDILTYSSFPLYNQWILKDTCIL